MLNGGVSQFVPKCPVLSPFVLFCPEMSPFRAPRRTKEDKRGQDGTFQASKRHININFLVRLLLGRPRDCPWDKPGLSLGQTHFVPGIKPGFLLILHNGSPVCPRDKPSLSLRQSRGRRAAEKVYVLKVYVPFSLANISGQIGKRPHLASTATLIFLSLLFLNSLLFALARNSLTFLIDFPFFPKDFRGSPGKKNPCFFRCSPCFFTEKARKGRSGHLALFNQGGAT